MKIARSNEKVAGFNEVDQQPVFMFSIKIFHLVCPIVTLKCLKAI